MKVSRQRAIKFHHNKLLLSPLEHIDESLHPLINMHFLLFFQALNFIHSTHSKLKLNVEEGKFISNISNKRISEVRLDGSSICELAIHKKKYVRSMKMQWENYLNNILVICSVTSCRAQVQFCTSDRKFRGNGKSLQSIHNLNCCESWVDVRMKLT